MHRSSYKSMAEFFSTLDKQQRLHILDVGSLRVGKQAAYSDLIPPSCVWNYTGLDIIEGNNVDVISLPGGFFPFDNNKFDIVISGQTLEHVNNPFLFIEEVYRVLKPGGVARIIAPSGGYEHHNPDYWRIMPDGMDMLLTYAGFERVTVMSNPASEWKDCIGTGIKPYINKT